MDKSYLLLNRENMFVPSDIRDDIADIIDDDEDDIQSLIRSQLRNAIVELDVDYAFMTVGHNEFRMTLSDDSYHFASVVKDWRDQGSLQIFPNKEILSILEANNIDPLYVGKDSVNLYTPSDVRDDLEDLIDDDEDGIVGLIKSQLKNSINEDEAEYVFMILGGEKISVALVDGSLHSMVKGHDWRKMESLQVEPTNQILSIFEANGVDAKYLAKKRDNLYIPSDVRDDIDDIIEDDEDDVVSLIRTHLKDSLNENNVEYNYMILGTRVFSQTS